jgi:hypothetical protein
MLAKRWAWVLPLLLLLLQTTSCTRGGAALGAGVLAGWAIANAAQHHEPEVVYVDRVVVVHAPPPASRVEPPPPILPPPPPPAPPSRPFDATQAKISLEQTDVAACRSQGVPRGYVHARVGFANTGEVTRVVIDAPAGLPAEAVTCIGDRISTAAAPPFDGGTAPLIGVSWFVP